MRLFRSARWFLMALTLCLVPASSYAGVFISINFAPPVLPVYEQPICPQENLIWTPGYWAYGGDGYFWVPGAWVPAPFEGGLWTPPYWGWSGGLYVFHPGYWGYHVGYYGGVNYGFGYGGIGFAGGEWRGNVFAYNTAVMHVDERFVHVTYVDRTVVERGYVARDSHVAFSGGPGGINHPPAPEERLAEREQHTPPTSFQTQHFQAAQENRQSFAKFNGGHPANLVAARPLQVESHPAPPKSSPANNGERFSGAQNGSRPAYAGQPVNGAPRQTPPASAYHPSAGNPGSNSAPSRYTEERKVTPQHPYTPPPQGNAHREENVHPGNTPPKENSRPAPKAKPEHEK